MTDIPNIARSLREGQSRSAATPNGAADFAVCQTIYSHKSRAKMIAPRNVSIGNRSLINAPRFLFDMLDPLGPSNPSAVYVIFIHFSTWPEENAHVNFFELLTKWSTILRIGKFCLTEGPP